MGVGFTDSAPDVNPSSREVPPPMSAEASTGTNRRFPLDHSSFEKLLAAAWVLQCLQDQLHGPPTDREEPIAEPVKTQKEMETANPSLQVAMNPVLHHSAKVTDTDSKINAVSGQPVENEHVAEPVEIQPPVETVTPTFDAAPKIELRTPELETPEYIVPLEDKAMPAVKLRPPVLANLANRDDKERARHRSGFNLQTVFNRSHGAFSNLLPRVRVNFTFRGLRAVAIATPIWLLSLVAALLFLEVWRHASFQSAQALSRPNPPAAVAAVANTSTTPTKAKPLVSEAVKRIDKEPRPSGRLPPLEDSHLRITDAATTSAVQQLSRYEIKGLRRRAKYGDESAAFTLGMAYEVGHSVSQNCVEAARWVTMAAEAGDAAARYNLGLRYRDGDGVPVNRGESEKWLRKAAAQRNQQAKLALRILASH